MCVSVVVESKAFLCDLTRFQKKLNKRTNVHLIYNNDDGGDENDDKLSS